MFKHTIHPILSQTPVLDKTAMDAREPGSYARKNRGGRTDMNPMEPQFRLAEIDVRKSTMDEKILALFRFDGGAQKRGPVIAIIAEISSSLYVYEQLLDVLQTTTEQLRYLTSGSDPMTSFERLVQKLNESVAAFIAREPTPIAWNRVNVFVVQMSEGHLCLSGIGRLCNVFLQKQAEGGWRTFDLFGSLEQPSEVDHKKPFASLICGDMNPGDLLFAGSQNFERLRTELQIVDRLKSLPPVTAAMEISQDLERRDIPDDFGALVLACVELPTTAATIKPAEALKPKSTESVERLHGAEQMAQAMLSPAITPIPSPKQAAGAAWKAVADKALSTARSAWRHIGARRGAAPVRDPVAMAGLRGMNAGHGTFMTAKKKLILGAIVLAVIAAIVGALWYRQAQKRTAEQAAWNAIYDQVVDRKNRTEADLVIGNEDRALRTLKEARDLLLGLDEKTPDRRTAKANMQSELDALVLKVRREVRVDQPMEIASLALQAPANSLRAAAFFKNRVWSFDSSTNQILITDPATRDTRRASLPSKAGAVVAMAPGTNAALAMTDRLKLLALDPTSVTATALGFVPNKASSSVDITTYNKRLYVLDPVAGMIWKYGSASGGFGSETAYLKQTSTGLSEASAIAIDSSVYVAFRNGRLMRYLSGVEESWSPSVVEPPMMGASGLWTVPETDRLAVADPAGKRVLVFRKDGKLVAQIVSAAFQGPRAVTGDAAQKKLYVVDGNRLLQLDLP